MRKYSLDLLGDRLDSWPFEGRDSNYVILRGNPQASGRIDTGSNDSQHRSGVWACTRGAFSCIEKGDELQTIIKGELILTRGDGEVLRCGPGDTVFTRKGECISWDILEDVTKVFFTYDCDGEPDD